MRPAELDYVVRQDKVGDPVRPLPAEGRGLLETDGQDVALITWKLAEDGNGTILRLQETAGRPADTALHFSHTQIKSAQLCSGVEDDLQNLPVEGNRIPVSLKPFEVVTIRVVAKN
jgi:alpha-mannosidase